MEINITSFFSTLAPRDYSASAAELGPDAGAITWRHACEDSPESMLLDSEEKREAFRGFVKSSGGWTAEEIREWPDVELNALFIQWISGDTRQMFPDLRDLAELTPEHWTEAEALQEQGQAPSNICRGDSGDVYFYAGI